MVKDIAPGISMSTNCAPVLDITIAVAWPIVKTVALPRLLTFVTTDVTTDPTNRLNELIVGAAVRAAFTAGINKIAVSKSLDLIVFFGLIISE